MKRFTIAIDEDTAHWLQIEAAKRGTSRSRFVGDVLCEERERDEYETAMRWYLSRERVRLRSDPSVSYPSREELYDRANPSQPLRHDG